MDTVSEDATTAPAPEEPAESAQAVSAPAAEAVQTGPPSKWVVPPTPNEVITSDMTGNSYTMGEKIGEGHFGLVFSCVDVWGNQLAAKVMKPIGPYEKVKASTEEEFSKLLLVRHPNITYLFDAWEYRNTFYLITERCHWSLAQLFTFEWFNGRLWVKPIARCLLQAVHFIHLNHYCHQDIHPGNVFAAFARDELEIEGSQQSATAVQFKLGDLGVAKLFEEIDATNTRNLGMLPPEALDSAEFGPMDHRIDIYHSALLLLQLALSKEIRFTEEEIKNGRPRQLAGELPPPLNFALQKALRRHVAFRTATAMELWRDLTMPEPAPSPQPEQLELRPTAQASAAPEIEPSGEIASLLDQKESSGTA